MHSAHCLGQGAHIGPCLFDLGLQPASADASTAVKANPEPVYVAPTDPDDDTYKAFADVFARFQPVEDEHAVSSALGAYMLLLVRWLTGRPCHNRIKDQAPAPSRAR